MRLLLGLLLALALSNCVDENVVPPSMRVIESVQSPVDLECIL